ncbi:hypothetical protein MN116_008195 [Schistosoma mekongi]|uniref:Uncharacterized protein n=1 Tax=Schistosoma mekongi TaxID=38744 RepID=A0AAE1Z5K4_SCHME|nr:hypothetical protein MN116_008195 [Schistosoma mekongi]
MFQLSTTKIIHFQMFLIDFQLNLLYYIKLLGEILAPFEDGGILNYLFEPIIVNNSLFDNSSINFITTTTTTITTATTTTTTTTTTNDTTDKDNSVVLLKLAEINDIYAFFSQMLYRMLFDNVQNLNVYQIVSLNQNASMFNPLIKTRKFIILIIIECFCILLSIIICLSYCLFIYPPKCIKQTNSLKYLNKLKITDILKQRINQTNMNCFNNDDNSDVVSCRSNQCNPIQSIASLHSIEWLMKNDENRSTNSSDIYINESMYNHQLSNQSHRKSITSSASQSTTTINHNNIQQSIDNQLTSFLITSSQFNHQCKIYLSFKIIIYCLLCINISLCIISFYAMNVNYQQFNLMNTTQTTFRNVLMNEVVYKLTDYLQEIIDQGQLDTKHTFVIIEKNVDKQLSITADRIIESILEFYELSSVIETAKSISQSINETVIVSQIINSQQNVLQQDVNNYIGELYGYAKLLNRTLNSICSQWNENSTEYTNCKQLQSKSSLLLINVDTKLFEFESSSVLVFLIRDLNINLSSIANQFNVIQSQLDMKKAEIIQNMISTFNLNSYQLEFLFVWQLIQQNFLDKLTSFLTIEKQYEIDNSLHMISLLITIGGYVIITFLLLLITLLLIYCILYSVDVYQRKLLTKQHVYSKDDSFKLFTLKIHGKYKQNAFQLKLHRLLYLPHVMMNKFHLKYLTYFCLVTNCFICLLLCCLFSVFTLLLLIDTEFCRYVNTQHGSEFIDSIIDFYLKYTWKQIFTKNITTLASLINFPIPKQIYSTLRNQCQHQSILVTKMKTNKNYSLLRLLNYTEFINFNEILYSTRIQKNIDDAKRSSINKVVNMNYSNFIPNDLNSMTSIARKLSVYLDGKDYKLTSDVKNLQEPITIIINKSIELLINDIIILLNKEFNYLFNHLLPCDKFNKLLITLLNVFCDRTHSIILSLANYIIIICITLIIIIITLFIFILYSRKHIELCMFTKWENIPLDISVKLCHQLLKYD